MQARLNERLGPEYISDRQGGGGSRMKYIEGWKAIDLANDVFGFNGWSTSIRKIETPICREKAQGRWDIGVYVVMRVTLRDGTFHEDVGWGQMENSPSLGLGLEKAKKEAVTDALKRSLRTFGRLLGNCLYDKKWVDWVSKV
ncbi:rad52-like protein, partial [Jaminaea rosea]